MSETFQPPVCTVSAHVDGGIGIITLCRGEALNALTTTMIAELDEHLEHWRSAGLTAVVLRSASAKAFCAGGDIRAIQENSLALDSEASEKFFASEYRLNQKIAEYPIPVVSLIDGICMGGGWGLAVHGKYRVVTEKAVLSMPETGIGFFPDVGASFFLSRLPGALGMYLGLTGYRLSGADALYAGVATHFLSAAALTETATELSMRSLDPVERTLALLAASSEVPESTLATHRESIDTCFTADTIEAIYEKLDDLGGPWAAEVTATLDRMSRQSLEITLALINWGTGHTLEQCLNTELALTRSVITTSDFIEGVRAALVDKDRAPQWRTSYFAGLDSDGTAHWLDR
nr:enoyl-CoA hydratase/isomerase family protein [Rhodococcus sp. (in: high G+C Gram-positive bacteria)]